MLHCALLCITPVTVECLQVRGGNANNSATVLAHLGFQAEFLGTIAEGQVRLQMKVYLMILFTASLQEGSWLLESLHRDGVSTAHCRQLPAEVCPNSVVISCPSSGSRTILHTNLGMPELSTTDLSTRDLTKYRQDRVH